MVINECLPLPLSSGGRLVSRLSTAPHQLQQSLTSSFLECQLASARVLLSPQEYRYWLLIYARFLVTEGKLASSLGRVGELAR